MSAQGNPDDNSESARDNATSSGAGWRSTSDGNNRRIDPLVPPVDHQGGRFDRDGFQDSWTTSKGVHCPHQSSRAENFSDDDNRRGDDGWQDTVPRTPSPHRRRDPPTKPRCKDKFPGDPFKDSWSAFESRQAPPRSPHRDPFNRLAAEALSVSRARPLKKTKHEEQLNDGVCDHEGRSFLLRPPPGFERHPLAYRGMHLNDGTKSVMDNSRVKGVIEEGAVKTEVPAGNMGGGDVSSPASDVCQRSFVDERRTLGEVQEGRGVSVAGVGFSREGRRTIRNGDWDGGEERPYRKRTAIDRKNRALLVKTRADWPRFPSGQKGLAREEKGDDKCSVSEAVRHRRGDSPPLPDNNLEEEEEEKKEEAAVSDEGGVGVPDGGNESGSDPDEGPECRVCRGDDEGGRRPLIHPCRCRGSIKYVHQDCLMEWIRSRQAGILGGAAGGAAGGGAAGGAAGGMAAAPVLQAQRCELCRERLNFRARYRPGAPVHLGVSEFLRGAIRRATPRLMNAFRCALNVLMWVVILPILFCAMFRAGIGVALFITLRFDGLVRGYGIGAEYSDMYNYMEMSEKDQVLPFVGRVLWGSWMDLFGDWCVGITLMMGFICLGPPCVELAVDFVTALKTLPVTLEEWWTHTPVAVVGPVHGRRRNHGIRPRDVGARLRRGILGALDRVENMLMGVLEQLILPPREEDVQGEGLIWGWPAVGTAGGFLGFMGLLMLFAQTLPYTTYLAVHLVTSPPERAAPFPYSALHPVPAKMFSWDSVRRPSPAATAAFSYTSLESKAYSTGLETLGFSSKWASFEESDGGSYYPWSAEALGFSGAMAEARLRSNAVRLRSYHPAVATVAVEAEEKAVGFKLPFSTIARVDCKGVRAMIGERMFFIPSPLFSSASDEGGYGASVIPRKPLLIMTKRNILEKNKNDGYGDLLPALRGLKAPEKLVTPEEALFRGVKNRGQSRLALWRTTNRSKLSRNVFLSTLYDRRPLDKPQSQWWRGPFKLNKRLVARTWVPGRRVVPSAPVYTAVSEPFFMDWVGTREVVISADKAYRQRPKWMPKHSSVHETSGRAESLVMGWWTSTVTFLKGPVIPGTFGLRTGVVFFDTFKGLCMLAIFITLACLIFSIARLYKITNRDQLHRNPNRATTTAADLAGVAAAAAARARGIGPGRGQNGMPPERGQERLPPNVPILNGGGPPIVEQAERRIAHGLAAEMHLGVEIKVMTIGMIELFLVPCWVGVCLDALSLPLFDSDGDARLAWTEVNPISSMALHWGAGTMATGVVSCLGREIARAVHPNLLPGWVKRPADQGLEEMLMRLTQEPLLSQLRGILISVVVYPIVLAFMMFVPMGFSHVIKDIWRPSWMEGIDPVVLGIGEATLGDRLGMDLVLFHFVLPVLMEHLKIRAPVRRITCWVLTTFCGITGAKELLLHPALVAGRGGRGNDPDDLDDIQLPTGDINSTGGDSYIDFVWDNLKVALALVSVGIIFMLLPAAAVLLPLFTGRAVFEMSGLPLDDDLPPTVAGAILCSFAIWAISAMMRIQLAPGQRRRMVWDIVLLSGKWLVIGLLMLVVLPSLTGLLVHDALRGPLPPAEETAVLTWGKMWALGLVCVKLWARCVMAGAIGNEAWQGRLRRVRVNGIRGVDFKYTLHEVCIPLLDCVGQYYFWPYLINRFVLPMVVVNQRDLKLLQKGMPFLFLVLKVVLAGVMYGVRKVKALHDQIRDDEYLVGVELENMPHDDS